MWSVGFRLVIWVYLPQCLVTFGEVSETLFRRSDLGQGRHGSWQNDLATLLNLTMLFAVPVFSFLHLKNNRSQLRTTTFSTAYSSLYSSLYLHSQRTNNPLYTYTYLQCIKRAILAYTTLVFPQMMMLNITAYMTLQLMTIKLFSSSKPMKSKSMNNIEIMNEVFVLMSSYYMILYTSWMEDVGIRYVIGFVHLYKFLVVLVVNFGFIAVEVGKCIRKAYRKRRWSKAVARIWEKYDVLIDKVVAHEVQEAKNKNVQLTEVNVANKRRAL